MSLFRLLRWHRFTIQTNEFAVNQGGAIDRRGGWINEFENLYCQLQAVSTNKNDERLDYHIAELEVKYILFHNYTDKYNKQNVKNKRILVWADPRLPITDFTDKVNIRVFNIISDKEPVAKRGSKTIFELYLEEVLRPRQTV